VNGSETLDQNSTREAPQAIGAWIIELSAKADHIKVGAGTIGRRLARSAMTPYLAQRRNG
jgi:hypothetical protein